MRRKMRRKNERDKKGHYSPMRDHLIVFEGDRRRVRYMLRTGKIRHQPRDVRKSIVVHQMLTRKEIEEQHDFIDKVIASTLSVALTGSDCTGFTNVGIEDRKIPDEIPDDPLPEQDKEGEYWKGYPNLSPGTMETAGKYAENEDIPDMVMSMGEWEFPIYTMKNGRRSVINNAEEMRKYIRNYQMTNLIEGKDHRCRAMPLKNGYEPDHNVLFVRCGDCGKYGCGELKGNADMGDYAYKIMHRKDFFCNAYGWTQMGGHGYAGGRRMICPECSKKYAKMGKAKQ